MHRYQDCKDGKDGTRIVEATSTTIVIYDVFAFKVRVIQNFEDEKLSLFTHYFITHILPNDVSHSCFIEKIVAPFISNVITFLVEHGVIISIYVWLCLDVKENPQHFKKWSPLQNIEPDIQKVHEVFTLHFLLPMM